MRTTQQLRDAWAPACRIHPAAFAFWTGVTVGVDARILPALGALDGCLRRANYRPRSGQTWGYACRAITGGTAYSLHAYGIAVDINAMLNPYGSRLVTDMPRPMVDAILAIRTKAGLPVWRWGGDYSGNKDAMHYEVVASPAELAEGIFSAPAPAPINVTTEDDMLIAGDGVSAWLIAAGTRTYIQSPVELAALKTKLPYVEAPALVAATRDVTVR